MPEADRQRHSDRVDGAGPGAERGPDRAGDHAAILRLTEELLPALIAKLGTTHLGELEVREGEWRVRLRLPYGTGPGEGRRSGDRPSRTQPGHEGHGHSRAALDAHRGPRTAAGGGAASHAHGSSGNGAAPHGERDRSVATSPAVGIFRPGPRAASGTRVRAGDPIGAVDVLGVPQDVTAPVDGIVGATLVEAGTAVEYGQELIRIELTSPAAPGAGAAEAR